jgi:hypothetical protein
MTSCCSLIGGCYVSQEHSTSTFGPEVCLSMEVICPPKRWYPCTRLCHDLQDHNMYLDLSSSSYRILKYIYNSIEVTRWSEVRLHTPFSPGQFPGTQNFERLIFIQIFGAGSLRTFESGIIHNIAILC